MKIEEKTILWKPVSEYTGGRVLATNGLDILIGELNPEGDCVSEDCSSIHLCGITHFAKIDGFFPELKESEERIRKWIKKELENKYVEDGIVNNVLADKAFAWLEKQKHLYETTKDRFYLEGFEEGQLYEKHKEQKPTEWSEEDEKERKRVVGLLEGWLSTFKETCYAEDCKCGIIWLKSLKPQNHWKPSDDEKIREALIEPKPAENSAKVSESSTEEKDMGEYKKGFECGKQRVLKYPEDFGLCKNPVWSEEDEKHLQSIISILTIKDEERYMLTFGLNSLYKRQSQIRWLKSLKPQNHWKPTEEQMEAIRIAAEVGTANDSWAMDILKKLYNQLKLELKGVHNNEKEEIRNDTSRTG